jgi:predicted RNA-binding protein with PUA-like domain
MNYWLIKTEPGTYSWSDLKKEPNMTDHWDGIRNYQARNLIRDEIKNGDQALFYHSVTTPLAIFGIVEVVREAYPDITAFDPKSKYYDVKSHSSSPRWFMFDVKAISEFKSPILREDLKAHAKLADLMLLQKGSRLSIQPVSKANFTIICSMDESLLL